MEIIIEVDGYVVSYDPSVPKFKVGDLYLGYTVGFFEEMKDGIPARWFIGRIETEAKAKLLNLVYRTFKINYIKQ